MRISNGFYADKPRHQIFGPVLAVGRFSTEEEAIELANNTSYGLGAGLHSSGSLVYLSEVVAPESKLGHCAFRLFRGRESSDAGFVSIGSWYCESLCCSRAWCLLSRQ